MRRFKNILLQESFVLQKLSESRIKKLETTHVGENGNYIDLNYFFTNRSKIIRSDRGLLVTPYNLQPSDEYVLDFQIPSPAYSSIKSEI